MQSKTHTGRFRPKNFKKYKGDSTKVYYRSSWERRFMVFCDESPNIVQWSSEELVIPYRSPVDRKVHRYFPDFFIKKVTRDGTIVCEVIEVKPKRQLSPPKKPQRQTKRYLNEVVTNAINQEKFRAAEEQFKDRKFNIRILTEDHLT